MHQSAAARSIPVRQQAIQILALQPAFATSSPPQVRIPIFVVLIPTLTTLVEGFAKATLLLCPSFAFLETTVATT